MPETDVAPETTTGISPPAVQGAETPAGGAAPQKPPAEQGAQTPAGGDTPASKPEEEASVPSSRLREETAKRQKLEAEVQELRGLVSELDEIGGRFGKNSREYLKTLREFYGQQDKVRQLQEKGIQPGTVEAELEDLKAWRKQREEQEALQPYIQQIQKEFGEVKSNPKFAVFARSWEKWERRFMEALRVSPNQSATEIAQDFLDLLDSEKAAYVKTKTEEGKRVIEGAGSGAIGTTKKEPVKIKHFGQVIEEGVKMYRTQQE